MIELHELPSMWLRDKAVELRRLEQYGNTRKGDGLYGRGCRFSAAAYGRAAELLEQAAAEWEAGLGHDGTDARGAAGSTRDTGKAGKEYRDGRSEGRGDEAVANTEEAD